MKEMSVEGRIIEVTNDRHRSTSRRFEVCCHRNGIADWDWTIAPDVGGLNQGDLLISAFGTSADLTKAPASFQQLPPTWGPLDASLTEWVRIALLQPIIDTYGTQLRVARDFIMHYDSLGHLYDPMRLTHMRALGDFLFSQSPLPALTGRWMREHRTAHDSGLAECHGSIEVYASDQQSLITICAITRGNDGCYRMSLGGDNQSAAIIPTDVLTALHCLPAGIAAHNYWPETQQTPPPTTMQPEVSSWLIKTLFYPYRYSDRPHVSTRVDSHTG